MMMKNGVERVTKRDYFERLMDVVNESDRADKVELIMMLEHEIDLLDSKSLAAKKRAEKKKEDGDLLRDAIYEALDYDEFMNADEVLAAVAGIEIDMEITRAKVVSRLGALVRAGKVEKTEVAKAEGKGKLMAYRRVAR